MSIELLAPGGSMESIRAAVNAGADAVYAGGRLFGARAYADNPETEPLLEAIDYCHLHGAKLYLTVNTLLKEYELTQMLPEYLAPIYEHGVDAVLVQDFGVFHFLRKTFPLLPLHASTQMTITGPDGVKLLQEMGAERVVLSRELSLQEILSIRAVTDVELETFVHGALCYCYSGKCLMSSMIGGRSGNRGRCAQPCRLPWDLYEAESDARAGRKQNAPSMNRRSEQYLLSPKDICTLRLLPDLIDAGIASLKIEGRMKSPEYAAGVTAMYRRYIDLYLEKGREGYRVDDRDEALLQDLFSRGDFSGGYYHKRNGREMMTLQEKAERKGDSLRHAREAADRIRARYVDSVKKVPLRARVSIHGGEVSRMTVSLSDQAVRDDVMRLAAGKHDGDGGPHCSVQGFLPSPALSRPTDRETVLKQIGKTGGTDFVFESIDVDLDDGLFVQIRDLNELRRSALEAMRGEILRPYRRNGLCPDPEVSSLRQDAAGAQRKAADAAACPGAGLPVADPEEPSDSEALSSAGQHPDVTASVCTEEQLEAVLEDGRTGGVYLDLPLCTAANASRVRNSGKKAYLVLPAVWREDTARIVRKKMEKEFGSFSEGIRRAFDGILVCCYDQLYALKEAGLLFGQNGFEVIADASVYTWNSQARLQLRQLGVTMDTLPYECSWKELSERGCAGSEFVVYGYLTLMTSAQCLVRTTTGCERGTINRPPVPGRRSEPQQGHRRDADRSVLVKADRQALGRSGSGGGIRYLRDRMGVLFPVKNDCSLCLNTIYNSVPLDLISLSEQIRQLGPASVRYLFTVESGEQTRQVLHGKMPKAVTRGHFRKGIE